MKSPNDTFLLLLIILIVLLTCTYIVFIQFTGDHTSTNFVSMDAMSAIRTSSSGSLLINKIEAAMKGSYTCEASNGFGKSLSKSIQLSVRGK